MKTFSLVVFLLLSSCGWAQEAGTRAYEIKAPQPVYEAPALAGHILRVMKTAGFWIGRHPAPDAVIMSPDRIDRFNSSLRNDKKLTKDIFSLVDNLKTESLLADLEKTLSDISAKYYYTASGVKADADFMDRVRRNMNLSGVVMGQAPRYGLVVHFAAQRSLPTREGLYEEKGDVDFDQLQNSALDVGTPVAVVHTSADGLWYYVMSGLSDGWVEAKNIALGDVNQVKEYAGDNDFVVVIKPKADIFLNESMTSFYDYVRMGTRLPLSGVDDGRVTVNVPVMDTDGSLAVKQAYMNAEDVNTGFLPFTARNIYKQALMMLNQPYGWGDMYGEQDCSRFVEMVFATVGLKLPRDSKDQMQAGHDIVDLEDQDEDAKMAALAKVPFADTLLGMKGHIMLYLGMVDGKPYAIHDTTGYMKRVDGREVKYAVDRVIISDLSLGADSRKGSLLKRLTRLVSLD
ncbi:MAG: SH3 domain-containing protein [Candidatus Omnitrophica bacterium]|nr:SH3 domain-containing protein [Candidatus Omnitrophota bacterium]MDE2222369.1 SH3 domain-containing protein [Candidatus Omnitrophota bacterium]